MGDFGGGLGFLDPTAAFQTDLGVVGGLVDPMGVTTGSGMAGGAFGETGMALADPLDLFGNQAAALSSKTGNIARQSAADAITAQEEMRRIIQEQLAPYQQGAAAALPDLQAMATEGAVDLPTSPQYEFERDEGLRNVNRGLSAQGLVGSTAGGQRASRFLNALGQEESGRQYGYSLDPVKTGLGAVSSLGSTNALAGQNIGSMYNALGSNLNTSLYNYGQQRQSSLQGAGNALQGLGSYLEYTG